MTFEWWVLALSSNLQLYVDGYPFLVVKIVIRDCYENGCIYSCMTYWISDGRDVMLIQEKG